MAVRSTPQVPSSGLAAGGVSLAARAHPTLKAPANRIRLRRIADFSGDGGAAAHSPVMNLTAIGQEFSRARKSRTRELNRLNGNCGLFPLELGRALLQKGADA